MRKIIISVLTLLIISGCKTTEPMYYYGDYSSAVYSYFKAEDVTVEDQITVLEEVISLAASESKPVAPGIHAHLGMLYFETGNAPKGVLHFNEEKALFPESAQYIDFLMSSNKETTDV